MPSVEIMPGKIRLLAIAAGIFSGIAGFLLFGLILLIVPSVLILGAAIQPYWTYIGRPLMWLGAFLLTFYASVFLAPQAFVGILELPAPPDLFQAIILVLLLVSLVLVIWCDAALIIEGIRWGRAPRTESQ